MLTITQHPSAPAFLRHTFQFTKYMLFRHVIPRQLAAPTDRHVKYKRLIWRALTWGPGHRRDDLNSYSGWRWTTFLKIALCVCPTPPLTSCHSSHWRLCALSTMEQCFEAVKSDLWTLSRLHRNFLSICYNIIKAAKLKIHYFYSYVKTGVMQGNMHSSRVVYIRTCVCMAGFSKSGVEIGAYSYIILALSNFKENISFTVTETALSMTRLQILG